MEFDQPKSWDLVNISNEKCENYGFEIFLEILLYFIHHAQNTFNNNSLILFVHIC